jgi:hypothetical protein
MKNDPLGQQTLQRAILRGDQLEAQVRGLQVQCHGEQTRARRILATLAAIVRRSIAEAEARRIADGERVTEKVESLAIELSKIDEEGAEAALYMRFEDDGKVIRLRMTPFPGTSPASPEEPKPRLIVVPGGLQ